MKNFKQACFGAATMAVMATGVAMTAGSAQAAILGGSTLQVTGSAQLQNAGASVGGNSTLHFLPVVGGTATDILYQEVTSSTGSFATGVSPTGTSGFLNTLDLTLKKTAANRWELQAPVMNFLRRGTGAAGYAYNLLSFILQEQTTVYPDGTSGLFYLASSTGSFLDYSDNTSIGAGGPFSAQTGSFVINGTSISGTVTARAVPTPALLPGLIGLGAVAWRKRKSEQEAVVA
jgi:hypothetical protein